MLPTANLTRMKKKPGVAGSSLCSLKSDEADCVCAAACVCLKKPQLETKDVDISCRKDELLSLLLLPTGVGWATLMSLCLHFLMKTSLIFYSVSLKSCSRSFFLSVFLVFAPLAAAEGRTGSRCPNNAFSLWLKDVFLSRLLRERVWTGSRTGADWKSETNHNNSSEPHSKELSSLLHLRLI